MVQPGFDSPARTILPNRGGTTERREKTMERFKLLLYAVMWACLFGIAWGMSSAWVAHASQPWCQTQVMNNGQDTYTYCYGDGWASVTTCYGSTGRCYIRYR